MYAEIMSLNVRGVLLIIGAIFLTSYCEGICPRTNLSPNDCANECIPRGCASSKTFCVCDGDCGYSCVKTDLDCGSPLPSRLANGDRTVSGTKFNDTATFRCNPGFKLSGSGVRQCRGQGTWDGLKPRCKIFCADPGVTKTTKRSKSTSINGFKAGTVLEYYCIPNYVLHGKSIITCKDDGWWSDPAPKCIVVSCGRPLTIGSVILLNNGTVYPTTVKFKCPPDYVMEGKDFTTCQENGNWSNKVPECLAPCSVKIVKNLLPNKIVYSHGERVQFDCKRGFRLRGLINNQNLQCINGTWSPQMIIHPYCQEKETATKIVKKFWESISIFAGK